jgi:hypothetical protein
VLDQDQAGQHDYGAGDQEPPAGATRRAVLALADDIFHCRTVPAF